MEHRDTLLTIAEIAIALAGFASIVSVIAQRAGEASQARDSAALRVMLELALRNAGFALLPLPFLELAPSDPAVWRVASGFYLGAALVHGVLRLRQQRGLGFGWFFTSATVLLAMTAVTSLANVFGLGGANAFSLYLASLLFGLTAAALAFLSVVISALSVNRL